MIFVNAFLFFGIFWMDTSNMDHFGEVFEIPVAGLRLMSIMVLLSAMLMLFFIVWFTTVKKAPHRKSHGYFTLAWAFCLIPALVLAISSVSISASMDESDYLPMKEAVAELKKFHPASSSSDDENITIPKEVYDKYVNSYSHLVKTMTAESSDNTFGYYLMRLHQGFFFLLAGLMNILFAVRAHLRFSSTSKVVS